MFSRSPVLMASASVPAMRPELMTWAAVDDGGAAGDAGAAEVEAVEGGGGQVQARHQHLLAADGVALQPDDVAGQCGDLAGAQGHADGEREAAVGIDGVVVQRLHQTAVVVPASWPNEGFWLQSVGQVVRGKKVRA